MCIRDRYLDGGTADSVPVEHALGDAGFDRAIVVLTQDRDYMKGPYGLMGAAQAAYAAYPYLLDAMETRHELSLIHIYRAFEAHEGGCLKLVITPWEDR